MNNEPVIKLDDHQTNFLTVALAEALEAAKARKEAEERKAAAKDAARNGPSRKAA
jgi:hypothetical protein